MNIDEVRVLLEKAKSGKRGTMARIARESGVDYRTLSNVIKGKRETSEWTLDKLATYFKKEARRAAKEEVKA